MINLRSRRTVLIAVAVATVATASVVTAVALTSASTKLVAGGEPYNACWASTDDTDWQDVARSGKEFGVDVLALSPTNGHVKVISAELIKPTGGLRLIKSVFAPYGGIGIGFIGERYGLPPYLARYLRAVPATLERVARPSGAPADFDGSRWQLGVVVSAPASTTDASTTGVKLTYRSGSSTHAYTTVDQIRLVRGKHSKCAS